MNSKLSWIDEIGREGYDRGSPRIAEETEARGKQGAGEEGIFGRLTGVKGDETLDGQLEAPGRSIGLCLVEPSARTP
jgi:hypothetical protein